MSDTSEDVKSVTDAREAQVFSAGGKCFAWLEVIEAARARGDWAVLQHDVLGLLARESELAAADAQPAETEARAAAKEFRYRHNLLSGDELVEWLRRRDVSYQEWMDEMRRSVLKPAGHPAMPAPEMVERACWVHAVCSDKLAAYARMLAEEIAVHLSRQPLAPTAEEFAGLAGERERFCRAQLNEPALAAELANNTAGWTRVDMQALVHPEEMVVREAALCVRVDRRELSEVAAEAGAQLREMSVLLDDAEPALRTRLVAAGAGELVGPLVIGTDHWLVAVMRRTVPSLEDAAIRARAETRIIERALAAEVNRHVNWHEHF